MACIPGRGLAFSRLLLSLIACTVRSYMMQLITDTVLATATVSFLQTSCLHAGKWCQQQKADNIIQLLSNKVRWEELVGCLRQSIGDLLLAYFHLLIHPCRRITLQRADEIWEHMLEQTEQMLPLRQHAVAIISMAETSVTLEGLQNPWLNLLFRAPVSQPGAARTSNAARKGAS